MPESKNTLLRSPMIWGLYATLAGVAFAGAPVSYRPYYLKEFVVTSIIAAWVVAASFVLVRRREKVEIPFPVIPFGFLIGVLGLSSLVGSFSYTPLFTIGKLLVLVLALIVLSGPRGPSFEAFTRAISITSLALFGFWMIGLVFDRQSSVFGFVPPLRLAFANPNLLAGFLALVYPFTLAGLFSALREGDKRWGPIAGAVATLVLALSTGSLNIVLCISLCASAQIMVELKRNFRFTWWKAVAVGAAHAIVVSAGYRVLTEGSTTTEVAEAVEVLQRQSAEPLNHSGQFDAVTSRLMLYQTAREIWTANAGHFFVGAGAGAYRLLHHRHTPPQFASPNRYLASQNAHSEYLELLVEGGVLALAAFLLTWGCTVSRLVRKLRKSMGPDGTVTLALLAAALSYLVFSLFSIAPRHIVVQVVAIIILALAWRKAEPFRVLSPGWIHFAFVTLICISISLITLQAFRAEHHYLVGLRAQKQNNVAEAEARFREALSANGKHVETILGSMVLAFQEEDIEEGLGHAERLREIYPGFPQADFLLADLALASGELPVAIQSMERRLEENPSDFNAHTRLAALHFMNGDLARLNASLRDYFLVAIEFFNEREKLGIRVSGHDGAVVLTGRRLGTPLTFPTGSFAGIILGKTPSSFTECQSLISEGMARVFSKELGASRVDLFSR